MQTIERLPGQLEGIGYYVNAWLSIDCLFGLERVLFYGFGRNYPESAENRLQKWIFANALSLRELDITGEDSNNKGYTPISFRNFLKRKPSSNFVDPSQPLKIEAYGFPAYAIDELAKRKMYGNDREEVVSELIKLGLTVQI